VSGNLETILGGRRAHGERLPAAILGALGTPSAPPAEPTLVRLIGPATQGGATHEPLPGPWESHQDVETRRARGLATVRRGEPSRRSGFRPAGKFEVQSSDQDWAGIRRHLGGLVERIISTAPAGQR
jgi:hypothetical protein